MRAFNAEVVKLFTTRLWLWLTATVVGLTGFFTFLVVRDKDSIDEEFASLVSPADVANDITNLALIAMVISVVFGIIGLTGEFRHMTITPTFLSVPQRPLVVLAKLVLYFVVGGVVGLFTTVIIAVIAFPILDGKGYEFSVGDDFIMDIFRGVVLVCALFALLGVGMGALLRNQVFAVVATILYLFVIENLLLISEGVRTSIYPYLPGYAAKTLIFEGFDYGFDDIDNLTSGQSGLVLAAWAVGLAVVGSIVTLSRDVT